MLLTALVFFLILSILVLIHELGHFLTARIIGVKVEEFGFGLPPRIIGKKIHNTIYSLNWLPIGGFVKLAGEDEDEKSGSGFTQKNAKHLFWARSKKERSAILVAGVAMNFLLAVGITTYLLTTGVMEPSGSVHVEKVLQGSPAESVGLLPGDIIRSVAEYPLLDETKEKVLSKPGELIEYTKNHLGQNISLTVVRNKETMTFILTPRKDYPKGEGPMGVAISDLVLHKYPLAQAPFVATKINIQRGIEMFTGVATMIWRLLTFAPLQADVAGPIGIAQVTGQAVKFGFKAVLEFMSILSLNLAVLNILPIPALDGGRLAFVFFEKILGKKIRPAFEQRTHQVGMIVLLFLVLLISLHDIVRIAGGG